MISLIQGERSKAFKLTAETAHAVTGNLVGSDGADGVLMSSLELGIILGLALQVHLPEHVQSRLLAVLTKTGSALGLNRANKLPAFFASLKLESLTVVTGGNDLVFAAPDQTLERQQLGRDSNNGPWCLVRGAGIDDSDAAVVRRKGKAVPAGRE